MMTSQLPTNQRPTIETGHDHDCWNEPASVEQSWTSHRNKDSFFWNRRKLRTLILKATAKVDKLTRLEIRARTSFLESKKPIFPGEDLQHPLNFLEMLKTHLKRVPKEDKIDTVSDCIVINVDYLLAYKEYWSVYEDFEELFIFKIWGNTQQNSLRKKIVGGSYSVENGSMARYFINIVSQARWLYNPIPDEELIFDIMNHFPKQVQVGWYSSQKRTVIEAVEFLRKMDEIEMLSDLKENAQRKYVRSKYKLRVKEIATDGSKTNGDLANGYDNANKRMKRD